MCEQTSVSSALPRGSEFCFWHDFWVSLWQVHFSLFWILLRSTVSWGISIQVWKWKQGWGSYWTDFLSVSACIMFQAAFLISHIPVPLPHIRYPWYTSFPSALSNYLPFDILNFWYFMKATKAEISGNYEILIILEMKTYLLVFYFVSLNNMKSQLVCWLLAPFTSVI